MEYISVSVKNMPAEVWTRVKVLAIIRKCSTAEVLTAALTEYLDREEAAE